VRRFQVRPKAPGIELSRIEAMRKLAADREARQEESIREGTRNSDEIKDLRQDLDKLRKEMEQLKKQLRASVERDKQ
jgi:soluble cytochrome b562